MKWRMTMILSCNKITKSFGASVILKDVTFSIDEMEKVAIVGANGVGKSTLLNIISGNASPDDGEVTLSKGASLGYLSQRQDLSSNQTIWEEMLDAKKDVMEIDRNIRNLENEMKTLQGEALERRLNAYTRLTHEFELKNGYALRSEVMGVLKGLGFEGNEIHRPIRQLSGGQKTRVALCKLLLSNSDLLMLDEPTNHLDMSSILWLENYLSNFKGTVLIVAHDRYFLDKVVSKVIEIEETSSSTFHGNYSSYVEKKAKLREDLLKQYINQQNEIQRQEEVIAKLRSFNREKSIRRAESRVKALAKIERLDKPVTKDPIIHIQFEPRITGGNDVLTVRGLSKSYNGHVLFANVDFDIKRGERIAILGDNGTGKTTLLKIINRLVEADSGEVKLGAKVNPAYYDQEHQVLNPDKTLFEELQDAYPNMNLTQVRNILASFLFMGDDAFKYVKDLSGGEKGRMSLAKLMLSNANFLILDEPTNHLDLLSKDILERALIHYKGTVLYVSHDRYFINKTATGILHLTNGRLLRYIGNYDYFLEKREEMERICFIENKKDKTTSFENAPSEGKMEWKRQKEEQSKIRRLQNELTRTESKIHELEKENEEIDVLMAHPDAACNASKLMEYAKRKKEIETLLDELLEQWESLSEGLSEVP